MRNSSRRTLLAIATVAVLGASAAVAAEPPDGFEFAPATEQVFLGIGCEQGAAPTCDSVAYWIGRSAGQSNVGNTGTFTPQHWVNYQLGNEVAFADFSHGDDLAPTYFLRTDEPITGQITLHGFVGGSTAQVAVDSTVKVALTASRVGGGVANLGTAEVTKLAVTPGDGVYAFELQLDGTLDGVEVANLNLNLHVRSVTAAQNGFVNGSGGSWFHLPYYELIPADEEE